MIKVIIIMLLIMMTIFAINRYYRMVREVAPAEARGLENAGTVTRAIVRVNRIATAFVMTTKDMLHNLYLIIVVTFVVIGNMNRIANS